MSIFPTITKEKQELYEKIHKAHPDLKNEIPDVCAYYGRACRRMDGKADRVLCFGCSLSVFVSTVEAILEQCEEKEKIGIYSLYDSDFYKIQEKLRKKFVSVKCSNIGAILEYLTEGEEEQYE